MNKNPFRELRKKRKLSQKDLARILGVSISTVSKIENGQLAPNQEMLEKLADCFEMDPEEIEQILLNKSVHQVTFQYALTSNNVKAMENLLYAFSNPSSNKMISRDHAEMILNLLTDPFILDVKLNKYIEEQHRFERKNLLPVLSISSSLKVKTGINDLGEEVPALKVKAPQSVDWELEEKKEQDSFSLFFLNILRTYCFTRLFTYSSAQNRKFVVDFLSGIPENHLVSLYKIENPHELMLNLIQQTISGFLSLTYLEHFMSLAGISGKSSQQLKKSYV